MYTCESESEYTRNLKSLHFLLIVLFLGSRSGLFVHMHQPSSNQMFLCIGKMNYSVLKCRLFDIPQRWPWSHYYKATGFSVNQYNSFIKKKSLACINVCNICFRRGKFPHRRPGNCGQLSIKCMKWIYAHLSRWNDMRKVCVWVCELAVKLIFFTALADRMSIALKHVFLRSVLG